MNAESPVIEINELKRRFGRVEAVNGLSLVVEAGRCYGLFGRNGAGKTTTIKCLLNLLRPQGGSVRVFGMEPRKNEVTVKARLSYVPDLVAFYPWMTVREVLNYFASFRRYWNSKTERDLLERFDLDSGRKATSLSKGQKTQLALIAAISPEPDLLILDEPTSGLDPIVRREFIETVIGAYQAGGDKPRTIFVSTHLISEFEGLIDRFTIIDKGRELLTMDADQARARFRRIHVRFPDEPPRLDLTGALRVREDGRDMEVLVNGGAERVIEVLRANAGEVLRSESLSLEEIFLAANVPPGN
jgi:ABC-2 type transport system ATP-binding protein